jgi:hypothetical protein
MSSSMSTPGDGPPNPATLGTVIRASPDPFPVVLLPSEAMPAVVLSHQADTAEMLLPDGTVRREPLDRPAFRIVDLGRVTHMVRLAASWFAQHGDVTRMRLDNQRRAHAGRLREIRDYAVAAYRDGDVCRPGLDRFLQHFELDAYEPQIRVWFTISGSYRVRGGTEETAARDGEGYLGVDLSRLDDVIDDTADFTVHVDRTDEVDE